VAAADRYHADVGDMAATKPDDEIQVVDNPAASRYEAHLGERILGIVDYDLDPTGERMTLVHTEVLPDAEGMGVGSRLAKGVLADLRERRLDITVECEFISAYLKRHRREYEDLVRD
jgi:predicted GNAT family acetyltransferase